MVYYNEFDRGAAAWLRELIDMGCIAPGFVDERSITEVRPEDLRGYDQCHFFAGIGGWSAALRLAGVPDNFPVWTASLPCQPFSVAGRQKGMKDERHLWPVFSALVAACKPKLLLGEQVEAAIRQGWLDCVFDDLEAHHYSCGAVSVPACSVGAFHIRQRLYWVAKSTDSRPSRTRIESQSESEVVVTGDDSTQGYGSVGDPLRRGFCGRDEPELGTPGREVGERQDGKSAADESRDGREAVGPVGDPGRSVRRSGTSDQRQDGGRNSDIGRPEGAVEVAPAGRAGDLADAERGGFLGSRPHDGEHTAAGRPERNASQHQRESGEGRRTETAGFWSAVQWLPCRDGKARPVEPGVTPLVDGIPASLVRGRDSRPSEAESLQTSEARVMRLKGYGNAICVPLAAEFVAAALEAVDESRTPAPFSESN